MKWQGKCVMHYEICQSDNFGQVLLFATEIRNVLKFNNLRFAGYMPLGQEEEFVLGNCWPGSECFCLSLG